MLEKRKRIILAIFLTVLFSMLVVSASLPGLQLQPGTPFPGASDQSNNTIPSIFTNLIKPGRFANTIVSGILGLSVLVFFFYFLANFLLRTDIRRFLRNMVLLVLLIALVVFFPKISISQPVPESGNIAPPTLASQNTYPVSPIGEPPETFVWTVLVILIVAALAVFLWILFRRRTNASRQDKILQQAQAAVESLQMGEDFKSVILRCYLQMTRVLKEEHGIERDTNLTAREFMELLQKRGISPSPIHDMTLLFESARYSPLQPGEREEQRGLDCLNEIIQDCRRNAG